jgi:hypothetical protein
MAAVLKTCAEAPSAKAPSPWSVRPADTGQKELGLSLALNLTAVTVSVLALAVSSLIALRQAKAMRHANQLPVVVDLFQKFRTPDFFEHEEYVLRRLRDECPPALGFSQLPAPAKTHFQIVAAFYTSIGIMVNFEIVDEDLAIASFGYRLSRTWQVVEPYVRRERELRRDVYAEYLEDFVARVESRPPQRVLRDRRVRTLPPSAAAKNANEHGPDSSGQTDC